MVLLPGPPLDSAFHQNLETDTLLTKLCGQDRLLRRLQEDLDQKQEEKEQLEAALELTRQQLSQATREAGAPGRAWGRQRLLQDRLVSVRATLCHLTQERERVWDIYSSLEQELGTLRETLEYLLHLGSPQSLPESLELSSPRSPEADWGRPPGGDGDPAGPRAGLGSPKMSRAPSPEGPRSTSPQPAAKAPVARPRMSAQEQLERMRRNQECGRPLPRPASPRLLTLGRTLTPARRQPDVEPRPVLGHTGAARWLRSSGSWSSPRSAAPSLPPSEGPRERVLSLSQALASEASQWHRMMIGGNVDSRGDPLPAAPPPASHPTPQGPPPASSPVARSGAAGSPRGGGGRGGGPAPWERAWDSGPSAPAVSRDEGTWPLRVTLLQSSF